MIAGASSTDTPCGGECCDTSGDEQCTSSYGGRSLLTAMTQQCSCALRWIPRRDVYAALG